MPPHPSNVREPEQTTAVYELSVRRERDFFNYFGKFALVSLLGLSLYFAASRVLHRAPAAGSTTGSAESDRTSPPVTDSADAPVVSAQTDQPPGPKLNYVASWGITDSGASISWSTDVPATTALAYGATRSLGRMTAAQKKPDTTHGVTLSGLNSGTTYFFVAQSADASGAVGYSAMGSFKTPSAGAAPTISGITVVPGKNNQVQISWKTSVPANSFVQFGPTTSYNRWSTRTELTTDPRPAVGWVPNGLIHYQLVSTDAAGHKSYSHDYTFVEP